MFARKTFKVISWSGFTIRRFRRAKGYINRIPEGRLAQGFGGPDLLHNAQSEELRPAHDLPIHQRKENGADHGIHHTKNSAAVGSGNRLAGRLSLTHSIPVWLSLRRRQIVRKTD